MNKLLSLGLNTKILFLTLLTGLLPLVAVSTFISSKVETMLQRDAENKLSVAEKAKHRHLKQYFETIEHQVENLASNQMVIDAARDMSQSFYTVGAENGLTSDGLNSMKATVEQYYDKEFGAHYNELNPNTKFDVNALYGTLAPDTFVQQYHYIANNPNALGKKQELVSSNDASQYARQHTMVHPILKRYLNSFGYYDIFIVHPENGDIIYSVFKEVDFGTSLTSGPYAKSNFATAYKRARTLESGESYLADFASYTPSYEAPASFIASPIYDGTSLVGVLCFQMPLDNINDALSDSENLGETGELVLIGEDGLMRSNSRLKPDTHTVEASFRNPETGQFKSPQLVASFTNTFNSEESLFIKDYRGKDVIASRQLLHLGDTKMLLVAKVDEEEAYASVSIIRNVIMWTTGLSILFIVVASLLASKSIARPIGDLSDRLNKLASGNLGQPQFDNPTTDEVGTLQSAFNELLLTLREMVQRTTTLSENLTSTASSLLATAQEQQTGTAEQASAAEETKNLLSMLLESSKEVAQAGQLVFDNADITQKNASLIATRIDELSHHVDGIGEILSLIKDIAAKSDLLALNAALEGTKAGEAGRGFSLVAMQMQKLAEQVMTSAKNIDSLTSDITKSTNASVLATEEATKLATETTKSAHQITFAVQQQQEGTQEASIALDEIAQVASEAAVAAHTVVEASDTLLQLSAELKDSTANFHL